VPTIDWPPRRRRPLRLVLLALVLALFFGGSTALSYYIDSLWFNSLGLSAVFWTTLRVQTLIFSVFALATFAILYGAFLALKPGELGELTGGAIMINGQPITLPVGPVMRLIAGAVALVVAIISGLSMMANWTTLALYWTGGSPAAETGPTDPIFGRPLTFYLFTLPAWQLIASWMTTVAFIVFAATVLVAMIRGGTRVLSRRTGTADVPPLRAVSASFGVVLLMLAAQTYLGRFERLFVSHPIFTGVTYTDAHVTLTGTLLVIAALILGAAAAFANAVAAPRIRWLIASIIPAVACYVGVGLVGWYVNGFVVKPNELVAERPFIANNIQLTRQAYGLDQIAQQPFPAEVGTAALDLAENGDTIRNIRLWDWRALQDTLRQIQEIRTYYDFPDIDIDRYRIDGTVRQMMLAVRELNIDRLPTSSRNWINEKLIYTHGYGITMNPVNGFTPEGMPTLVLSNMPVESTVPTLTVTRPEVYFGELTNTDVYVRTHQKEFNYPQGETNNTTTYDGDGGVVMGGFLRRALIALSRGDVTKVPFSNDITADSRLLMQRNIHDRVKEIAPFFVYDPDPYIVVNKDGRLIWMMDGFTTAKTYPYARPVRLEDNIVNYLRNSVKVTIDAYDGKVAFYVFDDRDPIVARYRAVFPTLFKDAASMPEDLRAHVRYPELMLENQADVFGLYHITNPDVFYNREDVWTVASEVGMNQNREQAAAAVEPNFVLMKLPGEKDLEFVEILPFTPANRNNLIGWIAGRSDAEHYGKAVVYSFPKTRLIDGPLQIEARIDQNAQLSAQLSLWNQQGSHVRRGNLIVIPVGKALLYAEPIYLQAERSPMPELRIVVLAVQDKLAYGPTFEAALSSLFGNAGSSMPETANMPATALRPASGAGAAGDAGLIAGAARDLEDYQRLTAEGKLGEAGQKLEAVKQKLEQLLAPKR
jgi:uncharacterized membrane protein (UPF0182 family)